MALVSGVDHIALKVADLENALSFFRNLLGFKIRFDVKHEDKRIVILGAGKINIELWEDATAAPPECPENPLQRMGVNHIALRVKKLGPVLDELRQHGYLVIKGVYEVAPGIREAVILGPENLEIQLVERDMRVLLWSAIRGNLKQGRAAE